MLIRLTRRLEHRQILSYGFGFPIPAMMDHLVQFGMAPYLGFQRKLERFPKVGFTRELLSTMRA